MELLISGINIVVLGSINILLVYTAATMVGLKVLIPDLIKKETGVKVLYLTLVGTFICTMFTIIEVFSMQVPNISPLLF